MPFSERCFCRDENCIFRVLGIIACFVAIAVLLKCILYVSALLLFLPHCTDFGNGMINQIHLPFIVDEQRALIASKIKAAPDSKTVARSWCNPRLHSEIIGADFGKGCMHWHKLLANETGKCSIDQAFEFILSLNAGSLFVCERAHLATPQTQRSLAQPFTESQLLWLYSEAERCQITIKLFPHACTRKAREWVSGNGDDDFLGDGCKSDVNDAKAIAHYVWNCNQIALGNPPKTFTEASIRRYAKTVRTRSNIALNAARVRGYEGQVFKPVAEVANQLIFRHSSDDRRADKHFINQVVAFSIASLVVTECDGLGMRYTYKGSPIGKCNWLKCVVGSSSVHHRGGVARSNIYWHRFRNYLVKFAEKEGIRLREKSFKRHANFNDEEKQLRDACMKQCRNELKNAYAFCVNATASWPVFEVLEREV